MESGNFAMEVEPDTQNQSLDAPEEDAPMAEPAISFDFVTADYEPPSTDDGSQDIANVALLALSEAISMEDVPPEEALPTPEYDAPATSPTPLADSLDIISPESIRLEVAIPELSAEQRAEYSTVESDVIEEILREETLDSGDVRYRITYTDGREDQVGFLELLSSIHTETLQMCFILVRFHLSLENNSQMHSPVHTPPSPLPHSDLFSYLTC